eukprot:7133372-Pyramimonas_sp.AAC.1
MVVCLHQLPEWLQKAMVAAYRAAAVPGTDLLEVLESCTLTAGRSAGDFSAYGCRAGFSVTLNSGQTASRSQGGL